MLGAAAGGRGGTAGAGPGQARSPVANNAVAWDPSAFNEGGHNWHGQSVMQLLLEQGSEEAVLALVRRFRAAFVEEVQPQYMPPNWSLDHGAKRSFGKHSVYHGSDGGEAEGCAAD